MRKRRTIPPPSEVSRYKIEALGSLDLRPTRIAAIVHVPVHQVREILQAAHMLPVQKESLSPEVVVEVLKLAKLGLGNAEIAQRCAIAEWRVRRVRSDYSGWREPGMKGFRYQLDDIGLRRRLREFERQIAVETGASLRAVQRRIREVYKGGK
jgi:hypothetical protein